MFLLAFLLLDCFLPLATFKKDLNFLVHVFACQHGYAGRSIHILKNLSAITTMSLLIAVLDFQARQCCHQCHDARTRTSRIPLCGAQKLRLGFSVCCHFRFKRSTKILEGYDHVMSVSLWRVYHINVQLHCYRCQSRFKGLSCLCQCRFNTKVAVVT